MFVNNLMEDNKGNALSIGGVGHVPSKTSLGNIFASNGAKNNGGHDGGQCNVHHGATLGDFWTNNTVEGTTDSPAYCSIPNNSSETVNFDPTPI